MKSLVILLLSGTACAFAPLRGQRSEPLTVCTALWRQVIPRRDFVTERPQIVPETVPNTSRGGFLAFLAALALSLPAHAVSGGGLDYAGIDITGQDFSNGNYKGKDFTQVIAKGTNFSNSNLQGCRFYKAYLVNADFTGADLRGASLEDTSMDGASLKGANAAGSYFGPSILDVATLAGADFTDAQLPIKTLPLLCDRADVTGATRDSLMCP